MHGRNQQLGNQRVCFIDLIEDEWDMEVFYNLAITPWLQFSPSVQYIDSGQIDVDHSIVVTTRLQSYF